MFKYQLMYLSGPASDDSVAKAKTIMFICVFCNIVTFNEVFRYFYCITA